MILSAQCGIRTCAPAGRTRGSQAVLGSAGGSFEVSNVTHGLTLPPRPCATPGCRRIATDRGRCLAHRHESREDRPSARARGYSSRWDRLAKQWLRDRPWCGQRADGSFSGEFSRCARSGFRTAATCVNHLVSPATGR